MDMIEEDVIKALDEMGGDGDAEGAHSEADRLILSLVHPEVQAALQRLKDRCGWWAYA